MWMEPRAAQRGLLFSEPMRLTPISGSVVSILLILSVILIETTYRRPGFRIDLPYTMKVCGNDDIRLIVVTLRGDGYVQINCCEVLTRAALASRLQDILKTTAERVIYVRSEPGVEIFQDFLNLLDVVSPEVHRVGWITPGLEQQDKKRSCAEIERWQQYRWMQEFTGSSGRIFGQ